MIVVLDASAAIFQAVYPIDPQSVSQNDIIEKADKIVSPDLFISEISNALWKYCRFKKIELKDAIQYGQYIISLVDQFIDTGNLWQQALDIAYNSSHSVYDCFYLALALNNDAILLTRDKKLQQLAIDINIKIQ